MKEIINILKNSTVLQSLIGDRIYPNFTTTVDKNCIVYSYETTYNDGAVKRFRLTITIIAGDLEVSESIENEVSALLLTLSDEWLTKNIIHVEQNGGGSLYDTARMKNHRVLYYDIISRSVNLDGSN